MTDPHEILTLRYLFVFDGITCWFFNRRLFVVHKPPLRVNSCLRRANTRTNRESVPLAVTRIPWRELTALRKTKQPTIGQGLISASCVKCGLVHQTLPEVCPFVPKADGQVGTCQARLNSSTNPGLWSGSAKGAPVVFDVDLLWISEGDLQMGWTRHSH